MRPIMRKKSFMRRTTIILSLLALAAVSPTAALGAAKGTERPLKGTSTSTLTIDIATGTGSVAGSGQLSHLGRWTFTNDITSLTFTGPNTFSLTLTAVYVAANGDEIFTTATGTGTLTATGSESTLISTIVGGTGRFTGATGTLRTRETSVNDSLVGSVLTAHGSEVHKGTISY